MIKHIIEKHSLLQEHIHLVRVVVLLAVVAHFLGEEAVQVVVGQVEVGKV